MKKLFVKGVMIAAVVGMTIVGVNAIGNFVGGKELNKVERAVNEFNELHEDDVLKANYEYDYNTDSYVISVRSYDNDGKVYGNGEHYISLNEFVEAEF